MEPLQILLFLARLLMIMKGYSIFLSPPELERHHQILLSVILTTHVLEEGVVYSQRILKKVDRIKDNLGLTLIFVYYVEVIEISVFAFYFVCFFVYLSFFFLF